MIFEPEDLPDVYNTIPRGFGICRMGALCTFLAAGFFLCTDDAGRCSCLAAVMPIHEPGFRKSGDQNSQKAEKRTEMEQKGNKKALLAVAALVVAVLILGACMCLHGRR